MGKDLTSGFKKRLGKTNISVSPLCYGCAAAYARNLISDDKAIELFVKAYEYGITTFDTGHSYGKAEERIGKALRCNSGIRRNEIVISTKFGTRNIEGKYVHDVSLEWVKRSVDLSLKRMGISYIDILYIHGPHIEDLRNEKLFNYLSDLKTQGVIKATGANTFISEYIDYICKNKCFDVIMLDYNIIKQYREPQIKALYENGIGVVAGQAMAESLFLSDIYRLREKKDFWYLARTLGRKDSRKLYFQARKFRFLNKIPKYDGSQIALKYVIDNPYISSASVGTCSLEHLQKNVEAINIKIPTHIKKQIKKVGSGFGVDF